MYMKKYKVFVVILIVLIIITIVGLSVYIIEKDKIKAIFAEPQESNTILNTSTVDSIVANNTVENIIEEPINQNIVSTLGTGPKRPSNYKVTKGYDVDNLNIELSDLVNSLKNETLKNKINQFIQESTANLEAEKQNFINYIEDGIERKGKLTTEYGEEYNYYDYYNISYFDNDSTYLGESDTDEADIVTKWACINGYLSIEIGYNYSYGEWVISYGDYSRNFGPYKVYCATYDLYTGEQLKFSDLFFKGEDYSTELYEFMQDKISKKELGNYIKRDFYTLTPDYELFTIGGILFEKQNPYFSEGVKVNVDCCTMFPVITISRDMQGIFNNITIEEYNGWKLRVKTIDTQISGFSYKIQQIKHWNEESGNKINNNLIKYMEYIIENEYITPASESMQKDYNTVTANLYGENEIIFYIYQGGKYPVCTITADAENGNIIDFYFLVDLALDNNLVKEEEWDLFNEILEEGGERSGAPSEEWYKNMNQLMAEKGLIKDTNKALEDMKKL